MRFLAFRKVLKLSMMRSAFARRLREILFSFWLSQTEDSHVLRLSKT